MQQQTTDTKETESTVEPHLKLTEEEITFWKPFVEQGLENGKWDNAVRLMIEGESEMMWICDGD